MTHSVRWRFTLLAVVLGTSCTPREIGNALGDLELLDGVCVTGYSVTIKPGANGPQSDAAEFKIVLGNANRQDAHGSLQLLMGVDGRGVGNAGNSQTISAQSQVPSFVPPTSTTYPAGKSDAYTSPVLVTIPYDSNAEYTIEIHKWLVGQTGWDATSCHFFKTTTKIPRS